MFQDVLEVLDSESREVPYWIGGPNPDTATRDILVRYQTDVTTIENIAGSVIVVYRIKTGNMDRRLYQSICFDLEYNRVFKAVSVSFDSFRNVNEAVWELNSASAAVQLKLKYG